MEDRKCGNLHVAIKTLKAVIDLEGCGPAQPRMRFQRGKASATVSSSLSPALDFL
jgi:hypothetical protein